MKTIITIISLLQLTISMTRTPLVNADLGVIFLPIDPFYLPTATWDHLIYFNLPTPDEVKTLMMLGHSNQLRLM